MKTAAQFTPARHNLDACLLALDAHWNRAELTADYGTRLLWLIRAVHRAWQEASAGSGQIAGVQLAGLSPRLTGAILQGGLLSLSTAALSMMQTTLMPAEATPVPVEADEKQ